MIITQIFIYAYILSSSLPNVIDILCGRPVWWGGGGGVGNSQLNWLTCCKRQKSVVTLRLQTNMM